MPESSLLECYVMLICWNCYNMLICHFCHDWCVHPMRLMSTCVLNYATSYLQRCLPCIFVINVVTSTSMQTRHRDVADFSPCSAVILMPCKLDATERSMHILRYFSKDVLNNRLLSIHSCPCLQLWNSLACHFRALLLLQNVSWQIVYMLFNFAKVVVVETCMLWTCSCLGLFHKSCLLTIGCLAMPCFSLWWVAQAHQHAFLMMLFLSCHAMACGEWIELVK